MATPISAPRPPRSTPPLEQGDQLTRDEFERRYEAMPQIKKAELIEGVVHMPSPVRWKNHANPHADMICWMTFYRAHTRGVEVGDNGTIRLDLENEPQPDGAMIVAPEFGGRVQLDEDDYVTGSPELLGEIAASSVSIDLNTKFRVYRRNNVQEYLVWRVQDEAVDWFTWQRGQYERLPESSDGILRSLVFPGLWLDAAALVRGDLAAVLQVLQQGIASPEHDAFVRMLQEKAAAGA